MEGDFHEKRQRVTVLIEKTDHGLDVTVDRADIDVEVVVVDFQTEGAEPGEIQRFDGADVLIEHPVVNVDVRRVRDACSATDPD